MLKYARLIEVLRWIGVLPTAVLGGMVVQFLIGALVQLATYGGWNIRSDATIAYALRLFLFYVPRKAVFVIAGAKMAPRHQTATALVLALVGFLVSLMIHIVGQHLAGNQVGLINYTHLLAESAGLLAGAACLFWWERRNRRPAAPA